MHDHDTPCIRRWCPACGLSYLHPAVDGVYTCDNCGAVTPEEEAFATEAAFWRTVLATRERYIDNDGFEYDMGIRLKLPDGRGIRGILRSTQVAVMWAAAWLPIARQTPYVEWTLLMGGTVDIPGQYAFLLCGHILAAASSNHGDAPEAYFVDRLAAGDESAPWAELLAAHRAHRKGM